MKSTDKNKTDRVDTLSSVTATTLFAAAIQAIVGYVAVWFFKPLWERTIKWWSKRNDKS